ncbi:MAG: single-stranded DNA-binding protein [Anaerohalosphaeraceae bacterium]|nr:single-stranded DNA-binding protein [Anaerohalosphaeraceae bacterium]
MANFNKVILLGNLTRDPQLSYTPSQTAVVDFGIATNRRWKGQDGTQKEETCFVDCRAFGKTAETINKYCQKGRQLMVDGRLTFDSWTGKDGQKRNRLRVTVENFQFIGSRDSAAGSQGGGGYSDNKPPVRDETDYSQAPQGGDDIPF